MKLVIEKSNVPARTDFIDYILIEHCHERKNYAFLMKNVIYRLQFVGEHKWLWCSLETPYIGHIAEIRNEDLYGVVQDPFREAAINKLIENNNYFHNIQSALTYAICREFEVFQFESQSDFLGWGFQTFLQILGNIPLRKEWKYDEWKKQKEWQASEHSEEEKLKMLNHGPYIKPEEC